MDFWGAELLTGQDEGAFGWITINYVLGRLVKVPQAAPGWGRRGGGRGSAWLVPGLSVPVCGQYSFSGEWIRPLEETLVGALDMGGASTQITFVPEGPIRDQSTQATFRLYGFDHSVYTHSYLCFGREQMLNRLLAGLVQVGVPAGGRLPWLGWRRWASLQEEGHRRPGLGLRAASRPLQGSPALLVRHPCYHSGYQDTVAVASLYESPCVPTAAPPDLTRNVTVEGTGNPGACISAIRKLFNFSSCQGREDCAFNGVYQPPVRGRFYVSLPNLCLEPGLLPKPQGPDAGAGGV